MIPTAALTSREECVARDAADPLRGFRDGFKIPERVIYLDGNSLGPIAQAAASLLNRTIAQEGGQDLIRSWNGAGWFDMPVRLGDSAGALREGTRGHHVVLATTSSNLSTSI